jgi:predicted NBD/HSP70 family sugar kinase
VASGAAIALQGQRAASRSRKSKLADLCKGNFSQIDAKLVFEAANSGDKAAMEIIERAAEYIGIGLSMAINVLDPDRVILCGGLMKNGPLFFDRIKASVQKHQMRQAARTVVINTGIGGEYSTANGACRMLANRLWQKRALPV